MRVSLFSPRSTRRAHGRLPDSSAARSPTPARAARTRLPRGESGLTLIEVVISSLLVAVIAIATLTGFDSAGRAVADERSHNEATLLAGQDQERMRGMSVTELTQFAHETRTVTEGGTKSEGGTKFTIESSAEYVSASKETLTCKTAENATASYIKTSTVVTWPELNKLSSAGKREGVKQSSVVSVPQTTTLEVKVANQNNEPVEGATVTVKGPATELSATTSALGCVVFGSIADKKVEVDASKLNWVNHEAESPPPAKPVTLSTTTLTTTEFVIAEPGALNVEWESNGTSGIRGDTAYASQAGIATPSGFIVGTAGTFATSATLKGLFPFVTAGKPPTANPYTVYAGDCEKNNPEVVTANAVKDRSVQVEPGEATSKTVSVEVPPVKFEAKSGTGIGNQGSGVTSTSAKLINKECSGTVVRNASPVIYEHPISIVAGKLEPASAPYAKALEVCVVFSEGGKWYKNKTAAFANSAKTGVTVSTLYVKGSGVTESSKAITC